MGNLNLNTPMNMSFSRPPSSGADSSASTERSRRPDAAEPRQREGEVFERLLRDKAKARDGESSSDADAGAHEPDASGMAGLLPMAQAFAPAAAGLGAAAAATSSASDAGPTAGQAALGAALNADPGQTLAPLSRGDAGSAWQVSLGEPMGVAVEVRATRPGGTNPAAWTLTIASPVLDASVLQRHAPRLDERLRARSLTHGHVRIQEDTEPESN